MIQIFNKYTSQFLNQDLEKKYIEKQSKSLKAVVKFSLVIFLFNLLFLLYSDFFLSGNFYKENNYVVYIRLFVVLYIVVSLFIIQRLSHDTSERLIFIFFLLMAFANFIGHLTFPNPELNYYSLEVMATFAIYLMFPVNIRYQFIGALLFASSNLVSLDADVQSTKIYYHTFIMLINANILGYFFARYYHKTSRKIFFQIEEEEKNNKELVKQKENLKKISGVIPVCFKCQSIRDDVGYEKKLEEFVMDNSDVQFTHSMCPVCAKRFLDEVKNIE